MMTEKIDIKSLSYTELETFITELGGQKFRTGQVFGWLHQKHVTSFDEMSNLSKDFREKLEQTCSIVNLKPVKILTSQIDDTQKYLFELADGNIIESVLMKYHHGNSVCISTQVGCRLGCRFCASTLDGLERNLSPSEMLDEIYRIEQSSGEKVSNIVLMGSGEPLDNYDNVLKFIGLITDERGTNISNRNITLSTCGLVPQIYRLAEEKLGLTLAISLHASDDETRRTLMPIANKYTISEILEACRHYFDRTGRRISFEYSLVAGVNDTAVEAKKLAALLNGMNCHVNLIPVNPIKERTFKRSDREAVERFRDFLTGKGINATVRREMGSDINGACGQLRKSYTESIVTKEGDT